MTGRETPPATAPEHRTDTAEHGANPAPRGIDAKLAGATDRRVAGYQQRVSAGSHLPSFTSGVAKRRGAGNQQPTHQQPTHREAEDDRCPEQCAQGDTLCDA